MKATSRTNQVRWVLTLVATAALAACGGGSGDLEASTAAELGSQPEAGAGGNGSYPSTYGTAEQQTAIRRRLAAALFGIAEHEADTLTNYSYNDFGAGASCDVNGYHGGHGGIDAQSRSVAGDATADEPVFTISAGTFIGFRSYRWGITAVVKSSARNAITGQSQDVYIHYLHLRSSNADLVPGQPVTAGTFLGIQGSKTAGGGTDAEHVHIEIAARELVASAGANPAVCGESNNTGSLDPYVYLESLLDSSKPNTAPSLSVTSSVAASLEVGKPLSITFITADLEKNARWIQIDWGDGQSERVAVGTNGASQAVSHIYRVGSFNWSAQAIDELAATSLPVRGNVTVKAAAPTVNKAPTVKIDAAPAGVIDAGATASVKIIATDPENGLKEVRLTWDGQTDTKAASGARDTVTFQRKFSTHGKVINWSAIAIDNSGASSKTVSGSFSVRATTSSPPPASQLSISNMFPASPSANVVGWIQVYTTGLKAGATVTLVDPNGDRFACCKAAAPVAVPPGLVGILPNFGVTGAWQVIIRNPDGETATKTFTVKK